MGPSRVASSRGRRPPAGANPASVQVLGRRSGRPRTGDEVTGRRPRRLTEGRAGDCMEDYENGLEQAATRLFLVAGVALVLVDETGELRGAVAAGDLAQALEDAAPQLWSGPSLEVLAGGEPVRTANLRGDGRWPALARLPALAGVNSLVCVPMEGPAGPSGTLTAVRRPGRPWPAQEVGAPPALARVVGSLVRTAAAAERDAQ